MFVFRQLNRVGHHSTSDDSSAYRSIDEINSFDKKHNPIVRFRDYMTKRGCWNDEKEEEWKEKSHKMVKEAFERSESTKRAPITTMFEHLYDEMTPHTKRQVKEMNDHVRQHHDQYPLALYEQSK